MGRGAKRRSEPSGVGLPARDRLRRWLLLLVVAALFHQGLVAQIHFFAHDAWPLLHGRADAPLQWSAADKTNKPLPAADGVDRDCPVCQVLHLAGATLVEATAFVAPPQRAAATALRLPPVLLLGTPANLRPYPRSPPIA